MFVFNKLNRYIVHNSHRIEEKKSIMVICFINNYIYGFRLCMYYHYTWWIKYTNYDTEVKIDNRGYDSDSDTHDEHVITIYKNDKQILKMEPSITIKDTYYVEYNINGKNKLKKINVGSLFKNKSLIAILNIQNKLIWKKFKYF